MTVTIVGAGPTGLMLACELGLAGVDTVVLERLAGPSPQSRAMGLLTRSIEVLDQRGLAGWLSDYPLLRNNNFAFYLLTRLDSQPPSLRVPQWRVEQVLAERATELGVTIKYSHEITTLDQDDTGVTIGINNNTHLHSRYLIGCDGGNSTVRKLAGITFPGTESTANGIAGVTTLTGDAPSTIHLGLHATGMIGMIPLEPGLIRLNSAEFGVDRPPAHDEPVTVDELRAQIRRISGIELELGEPHWLSRFGSATRLAQHYRKGNVFLAGDAAHVHFPFFALGMNTGIQDAVNLGWKLAADIHGWAPPDLLDTYHQERHPLGRQVCGTTLAQLSLVHPADRVGPLRELFGELVKFDEVNRYLMEMLTAIDIRYPMGPGDHPLLGRRITDARIVRALHSGHGVVVDLSGGTAELGDLTLWRDRITVLTTDPTDEIDAKVLLVRPDGYVAATDETGLHTALTRWFGQTNRTGAK